MTYLATITSKRQLTLPVDVFRKFNLQQGQKLLIAEDSGRLIMTPAEKLVEELAGSVSVPKKLQGKDIDKIIEQAKENYFRHYRT